MWIVRVIIKELALWVPTLKILGGLILGLAFPLMVALILYLIGQLPIFQYTSAGCGIFDSVVQNSDCGF